MGNLKHEGRAIDVVAPGATAINFGEVYRIDGWTGIAMSTIGATDTERTFAMEASERIWYVSIPSGVAAARGALLYWTAGGTFKSGAADLSATVAGPPVVKVEEAVDANYVAAVRVLND